MCTAEFTTGLLQLSKTWKPPWCPPRDECRSNMGYSHTMAYHSAGTKDAIQPFVTTRMAGRVLGEVNLPRDIVKYRSISLPNRRTNKH